MILGYLVSISTSFLDWLNKHCILIHAQTTRIYQILTSNYYIQANFLYLHPCKLKSSKDYGIDDYLYANCNGAYRLTLYGSQKILGNETRC